MTDNKEVMKLPGRQLVQLPRLLPPPLVPINSKLAGCDKNSCVVCLLDWNEKKVLPHKIYSLSRNASSFREQKTEDCICVLPASSLVSFLCF